MSQAIKKPNVAAGLSIYLSWSRCSLLRVPGQFNIASGKIGCIAKILYG
jgi:hypothetical protein